MDSFDLDTLLHPARAFKHPSDVVRDADLTINEKRAILASWASDACAVEAEPALRKSPSGPPVTFDDVMDALRLLDTLAGDNGQSEYRKKARRRAIFGHGGQSGHGAPHY